MKLYRFTASDNHRVIIKVHDTLGPEAMIYTTKKTLDGVEILAGLPKGQQPDLPDVSEHEVAVQNGVTNQQMIESLNNQMHIMDDNIKLLSNHIQLLQQNLTEAMTKKKINWQAFKIVIHFKKLLKFGRLYGSQAAR